MLPKGFINLSYHSQYDLSVSEWLGGSANTDRPLVLEVRAPFESPRLTHLPHDMIIPWLPTPWHNCCFPYVKVTCTCRSRDFR
jgi:hypothetical protein